MNQSTSSRQIVVYSEDPAVFTGLESLLPYGSQIVHISEPRALKTALDGEPIDLLFVAFPQMAPTTISTTLVERSDQLPMIVIVSGALSFDLLNALIELQPQAVVRFPFDTTEFTQAISRILAAQLSPTRKQDLQQHLIQVNKRLNQRLQEINTIYTVGKAVTSTLDINEVLERIVTISTNLTRAQRGFIILREGDQLYVRVEKNWDDTVPRRVNEPTSDNIAWQVVHSERPTLLHRETQITPDLAVQSLLYVPLSSPVRGTIGVLGVVHQDSDQAFTENHLFTLSSAADFAAIALENAHLFNVVGAENTRLRAILAQAAEAIVVTDTDNRLRLWSETARVLFNIPPHAVGHPIEQHINNPVIRDMFERAGETGRVQHAEIELENGKVLNAQLSSVHQVGRVAVMQDITYLKELDRLKSEFVSTVSHDLRTPLTTIQGYLELLDRAGPLTDMQRNFVSKAMNSLLHITQLIAELLDIGRIEAGYELEMRPVRLDPVLTEAAADHASEARNRGLTLETILPESPLWFMGNEKRIRQALDHLIENAIKYSRAGGWIKVSAQHDGHHITVTIEDNGIGIPVDEQPRVFDRFYRVQSPDAEYGQGMGLGLAIVKSIIEKHRGRIWVNSTPGIGSTFAFVVPEHAPSMVS